MAYLLLGRNFRRETRSGGRRVQLMRRALEALEPVQKAAGPVLTAVLESRTDGPATRVAQREADASVVGADTLEVFNSGKEKFPRLLADFAEAEHTITLMYLICNCGVRSTARRCQGSHRR